MRKLFILLLITTPLILSAQDSNLGNWILGFGNKQINDKINWHHEIQYRNYNAAGDLEQLLLRTGIGYNLSPKNNNLLLGYGYITSQNYVDSVEKVTVNEHRIYQQFTTKQKFGRTSISHRYRLEERFVGEDFKMRFRYFLAAKFALNNTELIDRTVYLALYNELFVNSVSTFFDRNRLYGGLGYKLNKNIRFELGYMNQYFNIDGRDQINIATFINY